MISTRCLTRCQLLKNKLKLESILKEILRKGIIQYALCRICLK